MSDRSRLTESPWFWVGLFAWAAILGAVAIGPKYAQRQQGLERRQEGREAGWRQRVAPSLESTAEPIEVTPDSPRGLARRMLLPLVGVLFLTWLAATWAIIGRRRGRAASDGAAPSIASAEGPAGRES